MTPVDWQALCDQSDDSLDQAWDTADRINRHTDHLPATRRTTFGPPTPPKNNTGRTDTDPSTYAVSPLRVLSVSDQPECNPRGARPAGADVTGHPLEA